MKTTLTAEQRALADKYVSGPEAKARLQDGGKPAWNSFAAATWDLRRDSMQSAQRDSIVHENVPRASMAAAPASPNSRMDRMAEDVYARRRAATIALQRMSMPGDAPATHPPGQGTV